MHESIVILCNCDHLSCSKRGIMHYFINSRLDAYQKENMKVLFIFNRNRTGQQSHSEIHHLIILPQPFNCQWSLLIPTEIFKYHFQIVLNLSNL